MECLQQANPYRQKVDQRLPRLVVMGHEESLLTYGVSLGDEKSLKLTVVMLAQPCEYTKKH